VHIKKHKKAPKRIYTTPRQQDLNGKVNDIKKEMLEQKLTVTHVIQGKQ
jgi:hypothetical protein